MNANAAVDMATPAADQLEKLPITVAPRNDAGSLAALCMVARFHQIAADPATLAHQLGLQSSAAVGTDDLLRAAKYLGLKAKLSKTTPERLSLTPLPALALMRGGDAAESGTNQDHHNTSVRAVILAQCDGKRILLQDPTADGSRPVIESVEVFATQWTGELILITS